MSRGPRIVMLALAAFSWFPVTDASAADAEISALGTQYVPQVAVVSVSEGAGVVWTNREVARYPVVLGYHNMIPDATVGAMAGNTPFPTTSPLLDPGETWRCDATASGLSCAGINGPPAVLGPGRYAYTCGVHPNQMRGILVVS